ncbi:type II RES/Xre toxin-antitoxin system antitoxin [Reichenbachiella ulvae]|uniref:DUF2384 domain-containing protein n=1 Tax=Reichenbachiella ulvae TaxID=2980104 RepID=A0ABT3CUA7_9BACT|nr:antitoxin Xre/MbcA/ParS toxin-binding domain-containing protein [Reichenbachiella ulvae]MCV9387280.1 DUF2384 domain-containing protein [Reichenbachiella ulvae]
MKKSDEINLGEISDHKIKIVNLSKTKRQMSELKKYSELKQAIDKVEEAAISYDTPTKKIELSRQGVSPEFVLDLMTVYQFSKQEASRLTDISSKTLDRHIQSGKFFTGLQSDRILELAELFHEGLDVFGSQEKFLRWLSSSLPALGNTRPKDWLDTHHGIQMITDELGRIKHGIFA